MRRFLKGACIVFLVLLSISFRSDAAFLPVTGIFEKAEQINDGWRIILLVEGQRASGLLSPECVYEIDGEEVTWELFSESALYQKIIVELDEKSGNVMSCRFVIPTLM